MGISIVSEPGVYRFRLTWMVSPVLGRGNPFASAARFSASRFSTTGARILFASAVSCLTFFHSGRNHTMMDRSANGQLRRTRPAAMVSSVKCLANFSHSSFRQRSSPTKRRDESRATRSRTNGFRVIDVHSVTAFSRDLVVTLDGVSISIPLLSPSFSCSTKSASSERSSVIKSARACQSD